MLINNHNLRILKVFYIFWLFLIDLIHGYYYFAFLIVIILHHMMVYHHYMTDIIIYIYITMYRNNMYNYIHTIYYFIYIFIIIVLSGIHRYDSVSSSLSVFQVALSDLHYFDVEASPPAPCFAGLLGAAVTMGCFTPPNCCVFMGKSSWRV